MLLEINQIGKREWLADLIARVDAKSKPVLSTIPKGEAINNMLLEYQADNFEEPADIAAVDGEDVTNFGNASADRALIQTYAMKVQDAAGVSDLAENVSNVAGLSKGELAESIMKKLEKLSRSMEGFICGDQDHQAGSAGVPYKIRGLGEWIKDTAQTTLPVDSNYRTPTASIETDTTDDLVPSNINVLLDSSYQQTGKEHEFTFVCGRTLRRKISDMVVLSTGGTNTVSNIRTYQTGFAGTVDNVVDVFRGDFGTLKVMPSLFCAHANFGGSSTKSAIRGYGLIMDLLSLHYKRMPRVRQIEDRGGGPRFIVDAIFALCVKNPLPLIAVKSTAASD